MAARDPDGEEIRSHARDRWTATYAGAGGTLSGAGGEPNAASAVDELWGQQLSHRMRVLLHAQPLFDLRYGDPHRDPSLRHYDSLALALKVLDLIIETTGLDREVNRDMAVAALEPLLAQMDDAAAIEPDPARHSAMAERVVSALLHDDEGGRPFRVPYTSFEDGQITTRILELHLAREHHMPDGRIVMRLSNEAINLFLNALKLDIEDAQSAAEAVVQSQLARGRFDEAVASARDARIHSLRLQAKIDSVLIETRRDLARVNWVDEVPRLIAEALVHIRTRCTVEEAIAASARETLDQLPLGSPEAQRVAMVARLIEDCRQRHVDLHGRLIGARGVFLDEQERQSFAPRTLSPLPNLLGEVLEPLLAAPRSAAERAVAVAFPALSGACPPRMFSLPLLFSRLLQPRRENHQGSAPAKIRDLVAVSPDELRYPVEVRRRAAAYLDRIAQPSKLSTMLDLAAAEGESEAVLEYLALTAFRLFDGDTDEVESLVSEHIAGARLDRAGFTGDDLLLRRREAIRD